MYFLLRASCFLSVNGLLHSATANAQPGIRRPAGNRNSWGDAMHLSVRAARLLSAAAAAASVLSLTTAASAATRPSPAPKPHPAATAPRCGAASLGVWLAIDQGNGAAGSIFYPLQFTNLSHRACTLTGFPGVAAVNQAGHRLGRPASRDTTTKVTTVRLAAGATAHAILRYSNVLVGDCPAASRKPAFELRVYPPGRHVATHALFGLDVCTTGPAVMSVQAIKPGPGTAAG